MMNSDFETLKSKYHQAVGQRDALSARQKDTEKKGNEWKARIGHIESAQAFLQRVAQETQEILKFQISDIVQMALDSVFPGQYEFYVDFVVKNNRTFADMYLLRNGTRVDPMDASGGGVVDIVSFAVRLAAWTLSQNSNVIILDEPFKYLSTELRPIAGQILAKLSKTLKLQVIMVTHDKAMIEIADKAHDVKLKDGVSQVKSN